MIDRFETLKNGDIITAVVVLLVLVWAVKQILDFVLTIRNVKKPHMREAEQLADKQRVCDTRMGDIERKTDELDERLKVAEEGQRVLCKGVYEILGHMLHNGNKDAMEQASRDIFDYLNS